MSFAIKLDPLRLPVVRKRKKLKPNPKVACDIGLCDSALLRVRVQSQLCAVSKLGLEIEAALNKNYDLTDDTKPENRQLYVDQARNIIFNFKDQENDLKKRVEASVLNTSRDESITLDELVMMDADEMASNARKQERERRRKENMELACLKVSKIATADYVCANCSSNDARYEDIGQGNLDCTKTEVWGSVSARCKLIKLDCLNCGFIWEKEVS